MGMKDVQQLAVQALMQVALGRNLSDVLSNIMQTETSANALSQADKGALQDITFGCCRHQALLFGVIKEMTDKLPKKEVLHLLQVALYQLRYTKAAAHAVVHEAVNLARRKNADRLVNALLRRYLREGEYLAEKACQHDEAAYGLPLWWLRELQTSYPDSWENICRVFKQKPPLTLRVNRRKMTGEDYLHVLRESGIEAVLLDDYAVKLKSTVPVSKLPLFYDGVVSVQDFGAQKAAELLNVQAGERVLDACAAPGGKTGHLLEWNDVQLTALDISHQRLCRVQENLERLGFSATLNAVTAEKVDAWYDGVAFDAILADVPCTASGVVRRHPDIKCLRQPDDASKTAAQQEVLLDALWSTLKIGGRMLLATCSIFAAENQLQLQRFLSRHHEATCTLSLTLLPHDDYDGFFYALIHKTR